MQEGLQMLNYSEPRKRTHTAEKPYECKGCGRSLERCSSLPTREETHPGQIPCECKHWGGAYSYRSFLQVPMKMLAGTLPSM